MSYEKVEKLLDAKNITAYRVSKDTGLSPTLFTDWKKKRSKPKVDKLLILARYFDVPLEYFVGEGEN